MKRALVILLSLLFLAGCSPAPEQTVSSPSPTQLVTAPPTPEQVTIENAAATVQPMDVPVDPLETVEDFYMTHHIQLEELYPASSGLENWTEVSTAGLVALGARVYRNSLTHMTVLVYRDIIHILGEFEGGDGIVEMSLKDANLDGRLNLCYTFTYFDGESLVTASAYFDFVTETEILTEE